MKKILLLLSLILIICAVCFIPVTEQRTVTIKATFFNVYQQLINGNNWKNWRTDFNHKSAIGSSKVSVKQNISGFELKYSNLTVKVIPINGYSFKIEESDKNKLFEYSFTAFPDKSPDKTTFTVTQQIDVWRAVLNRIMGTLFLKTHVEDFKNYMESTVSYYGYNIIKSKVTDTEIIVLRQSCLTKNKFIKAISGLSSLRNYLNLNGLKETQPFIAQFLQKSKDSTQLNIGIPVNKKAFIKNPFDLMQMPESGTLYIVKFKGKFNDREKAYAAVERYFGDRQITKLMLPFETYLDNKIPQSDTSEVNIQINFPSF